MFPNNQLNSVNTCSRSEGIKRNVNYTQNVNGLTDFINFRYLKLKKRINVNGGVKFVNGLVVHEANVLR